MSFPDRFLIRGKDIGLIVGILTLCSIIWKFSEKPVQWTEAYDGIKAIQPRIEIVEKKQTEMEARNIAQMSLIIRELDGIHRELRKRGD